MTRSPAPPLPRLALADRGVIAISGPEAVDFLQGLASQDVRLVSPDRTLYGALLTPQGKFLHDFHILWARDGVWLDCEAARRDDLLSRLRRYRLRARLDLRDLTDQLGLWAGLDGPAGAGPSDPRPADPGPAPGATCQSLPAWPGAGPVWRDPRHAGLGYRLVAPRHGQHPPAPSLDRAAYERRRLSLGIPDGSRDIDVEKSGLLEAGLDRFNGVAWEKGCYVGQEVTARTHYRGTLKRRLFPVVFHDGPAPAPGTPVTDGEKTIGAVRSSAGDRALALLPVAAARAATPPATSRLTAGGTRLSIPPGVPV